MANKSVKYRKFFLSAGHGEWDPGAVVGNISEYEENKNLVNRAISFLKQCNLKHTELVVVPAELNVQEAVDFINANSQNIAHDLALEVHHNSNVGQPGTGTETYFGNTELAREVHEEFVKYAGLRDRGVKDGSNLLFNRSTRCASALLEVGFLNNPKDLGVIRAKGAEALARAVVRAAEGQWMEEPLPEEPTPPGEIEYNAMCGWLLKIADLIYKNCEGRC